MTNEIKNNELNVDVVFVEAETEVTNDNQTLETWGNIHTTVTFKTTDKPQAGESFDIEFNDEFRFTTTHDENAEVYVQTDLEESIATAKVINDSTAVRVTFNENASKYEEIHGAVTVDLMMKEYPKEDNTEVIVGVKETDGVKVSTEFPKLNYVNKKENEELFHIGSYQRSEEPTLISTVVHLGHDGTDLTGSVVFLKPHPEAKEVLENWWVVADSESGLFTVNTSQEGVELKILDGSKPLDIHIINGLLRYTPVVEFAGRLTKPDGEILYKESTAVIRDIRFQITGEEGKEVEVIKEKEEIETSKIEEHLGNASVLLPDGSEEFLFSDENSSSSGENVVSVSYVSEESQMNAMLPNTGSGGDSWLVFSLFVLGVASIVSWTIARHYDDDKD